MAPGLHRRSMHARLMLATSTALQRMRYAVSRLMAPALLGACVLAIPARAMTPPTLTILWMQVMPDGDMFVREQGGALYYTDNQGKQWVGLSDWHRPFPLDGTDRFELDEYIARMGNDHLGFAFSLAHAWPRSEMRGTPVRTAGDGHLACYERRIIARARHASTWIAIADIGRGESCSQMLADGDTLLAVAGNTVFRSNREGRAWTASAFPKDARGRTPGLMYAVPKPGIFTTLSGGTHPGPNGFARSTDGGRHWSFTDFPQSMPDFSLVGGAHGVLYAERDNVLFASKDAGATWRADNPRQRQRAETCNSAGNDTIMSVQGDAAGALYVVTPSALYKRQHAGAAWVALPVKGLKLHIKPDCRVDQLL